MLAQPLQGLLRHVGLHHHQTGPVDELQPLPQKLRGDVVVNGHIVDGQSHVAVAVVDEQIGAGVAAGDHGAVAQVKADGGGVVPHVLGKAVLAQHRHHRHLLAQQAQVVGDVAAHAAQRGGHLAGIGVPGHQRRVGHRADVHVHAAHHHDIGLGAQQITPSGDIALFHQVGDMHRRTGTGNARLFRQLLLGDHGILADPLQYLSFPLGHGLTSVSKNYFLITCLLYTTSADLSSPRKGVFSVQKSPLWRQIQPCKRPHNGI